MSENEAVFAKAVTRKRLYTLSVMIIAFFSALILWFYVLGYDSPYYEKEFSVQVNVEGTDALREKKGFAVVSDFGFTIKVVVSGTQTEVNKLRDSDIKAFVDVSEVASAGSTSLPIQVTVSNENGITVKSKSVESAVIFIDKNVVAEIPVRVDIAGYSLDSGYSLGDYTISPVTVTVQGPESEISKISYAHGTVQPKSLKGSAKFNTVVSLYNSSDSAINNSYITLLDTSVTVSVPVYMTADIPVKVYFVGGYYSTDMATITLSDEYVTVRGLVEDFEDFNEVRINVAENTLISDTVMKTLYFPDGIECVSGQTAVTAKIVFNELVTRVVASSASSVCEITNIPEGLSAKVVTVNMLVGFTGPHDIINNMTAASYRAIVDLSEMTLIPGESYLVPIKIVYTDESIKGVCPNGEFAVTVAISEEEQLSPDNQE